MRNALLAQAHVTEVGIDSVKQLAHVVPDGDFDVDLAIAALQANGYGATLQE